jgi:hypothetical protein
MLLLVRVFFLLLLVRGHRNQEERRPSSNLLPQAGEGLSGPAKALSYS